MSNLVYKTNIALTHIKKHYTPCSILFIYAYLTLKKCNTGIIIKITIIPKPCSLFVLGVWEDPPPPKKKKKNLYQSLVASGDVAYRMASKLTIILFPFQYLELCAELTRILCISAMAELSEAPDGSEGWKIKWYPKYASTQMPHTPTVQHNS